MWPKIGKRAQTAASLVAAIFPWLVAAAQNPPTASLAEQLKAQYKVAKLGQQDNTAKVLNPGTVLVIQKGGIIPVPYASTAVCSSRYQEGKLDSPDALCPETTMRNSAPFKVGEKVYPLQINVDLKQEKISFHIVACDSCNGTNPPTALKSEVIFQFAPGFLEHAGVLDVEDTIGDVLAMDSGAVALRPEPMQSQPEVSDPSLLTNEKVTKMASAKLGDAVIVSTIKRSQSNFDTSPDALIKLKQAGVSDDVLKAMIEAGAAPQPEAGAASAAGTSPADATTSAPTQPTFSVQHRHVSLVGPGSDAIYYCSGDLSISADGTVRYDCTQTDDPSGRCDHVSIPPGSLKQAKVGYNGLHLATNGRGNFDFVGDSGTINAALKMIAPLVGTAPATSAVTVAQPPTPAASSCGDYESCMKNGAASLEQPGGDTQALTEFQKASQLDPSKGEPWAGMGEAYLQMGQYGYVSAMWDKALQNGSILSISVCHAGIACGDTGNFLISVKEVSFVNKKGEKEFVVAPSAITSVESASHGFASTYYWQLQLQGKKNYRFYYGPRGIQCKSNFICPEPGLTQQKVVADYLHNTLDKLRAGTFASQPNNP
jgi:hypothetical protein